MVPKRGQRTKFGPPQRWGGQIWGFDSDFEDFEGQDKAKMVDFAKSAILDLPFWGSGWAKMVYFDHFGPFCPWQNGGQAVLDPFEGVQIRIWAHFCLLQRGPEAILDPFWGPNWDLGPFCLAKWGLRPSDSRI